MGSWKQNHIIIYGPLDIIDNLRGVQMWVHILILQCDSVTWLILCFLLLSFSFLFCKIRTHIK